MANTKVEAVNELLRKGEPGNISVDEHADYTGYKPQAVVDAMNEVFWGEWGFTELGNEIVPTEKGGGLAVAKVEVWIKGNDFHPTGWGQNRVTRGDEGDARKGAQTDALKKALSYFGVGNRAYHGLLPNKKEQAAARQQGGNQQQNGNAARPAQQAPVEKEPIDEAPATDAQLTSMRKLYEHLGLPMPKRSLTYAQARTAIKKLSDAWKEKQDAAAVPLDQVSAELAQKQGAAV